MINNSVRTFSVMESREFKKLFGQIAIQNGFKSAHTGWYKESTSSIVALNLQKSNFDSVYYLNIKTYIHGIFNERYIISKYLIVNDIGDIFTRQPNEYNDAFDLNRAASVTEREKELQNFFQGYLNDYVEKSLSIEGINKLAQEGKINLLPAVEEGLKKLKDF